MRHHRNVRSTTLRRALGLAAIGLLLPTSVATVAHADLPPLDSPVDCPSGFDGIPRPLSCNYDSDAIPNLVDWATDPADPTINDVKYGALLVRVRGSGQLTSSDGRINCGSYAWDCGENYIVGSPVSLTATAVNGSSFEGWSLYTSAGGTNLACSLTATSCSLVMAEDFILEARFSPAPVVEPSPTPIPEPTPTSPGNGNGKGPKK